MRGNAEQTLRVLIPAVVSDAKHFHAKRENKETRRIRDTLILRYSGMFRA
ncbi:Uncharacterized protein dnm_036530 [Desulfonema magnum]|uniref:Uncharacterized protein n=1 Tax=Desulfonema magnum TaxID=45655 RepID=A0A975BLH8_9BACT|nr:Uncharacterized protein dnm_036530 [Desulfonema magnum]